MLLHERDDYADLLRIVANARAIRDAIVEKDYWVTHVLQALRGSEFRNAFIFKGGTSLSKGWNLIDRFSEDIDLLLIGDGLGGKAKRRRTEEIEIFVGGLPGLRFDKDNPANRSGKESRTSCFRYRSVARDGLGALLPYVKLEIGFRGGIEPNVMRPIQAIFCEEIEKRGQTALAENIGAVYMPLLHPRRTLVEKLFALYSAYEAGEIAGKTRHYYDVHRLLGLEDVTAFLGTQEYVALKESVAAFSRENWPNSPLPPGNALAGGRAFLPEEPARAQIALEYERADYYYGVRPGFAEILDRLKAHHERF